MRTCCALAREAGAALYVAHVCGERAMDAIAGAARRGSRCTARCCTTACASRLADYLSRMARSTTSGWACARRSDRRRCGRARGRSALDAGHGRVHDDRMRSRWRAPTCETTPRRPRRHRDARHDRASSEGVDAGRLTLRAVRRGVRHQPGPNLGHVPAEGRDRARQRRRHRALGPRRPPADHDRRPAPRRRLQAVGGLARQRASGDDDAPRPGRRRGRRRSPERPRTAASSSGRCNREVLAGPAF